MSSWREAASPSFSVPSCPTHLPALADLIRSGAKVVFVTGAGLSAPSGVPAFRGESGEASSSSPLWAKEWGTRARFLADPRAWYDRFWIPGHVVRDPEALMPRVFEPNAGHAALAAIAERNPAVAVISMAVDGLQAVAGAPTERLAEIHGRADRYKCAAPTCRYATSECIDGPPLTLRAAPAGRAVIGELPRCPGCGGPSLPQVLLYDEEYDSHALFQHRRACRWLGSAQALVLVGTSCGVGIAHAAVLEAVARRLPVFSLGAGVEPMPQLHEPAQPHTGSHASPQSLQHAERRPSVAHIVGGCEHSLPALEALLGATQLTAAAHTGAGAGVSAADAATAAAHRHRLRVAASELARSQALSGFGATWTEVGVAEASHRGAGASGSEGGCSSADAERGHSARAQAGEEGEEEDETEVFGVAAAQAEEEEEEGEQRQMQQQEEEDDDDDEPASSRLPGPPPPKNLALSLAGPASSLSHRVFDLGPEFGAVRALTVRGADPAALIGLTMQVPNSEWAGFSDGVSDTRVEGYLASFAWPSQPRPSPAYLVCTVADGWYYPFHPERLLRLLPSKKRAKRPRR